MNVNPLGKTTQYNDTYDPSVLFPIARSVERSKNAIKPGLFKGFDNWTCYELSYLNNKGKPVVSIVKISYPADTECIVESKSLKLYLNGFIMSKFDDEQAVIETIRGDLNKVLKTDTVSVSLIGPDAHLEYSYIPRDLLIDDLDVTIDVYKPDIKLLQATTSSIRIVERYSNLLKTNCPITDQPDWGTVYIKYKASRIIDDASLLKYIVSFRRHSGYHESCCERIFNDILTVCKPEFLVVQCFYTRRGGIDINPVRYTGVTLDDSTDHHYWRQ